MSSASASDGGQGPDGGSYPYSKADSDWRDSLTSEQYQVLRKAGTEPGFSGDYVDGEDPGTYHCRACDAPLFSSTAKFKTNCGWPSFFTPLAGDSVVLIEDQSLGMTRVEARCANCGSHLGHVFSGEGYETPTDQRWCINSISLRHAQHE